MANNIWTNSMQAIPQANTQTMKQTEQQAKRNGRDTQTSRNSNIQPIKQANAANIQTNTANIQTSAANATYNEPTHSHT